MSRYDPFNLVHKGLRASLYHTAISLQQADFTDEVAAELITEKVQEVIMLIHHYERQKEHHVFPAIFPYEPSVVASFQQQKSKLEICTQQVNLCLQQIQQATSHLERLVAGSKVNASFVTFVVFNLKQFAEEEKILTSLLWRYFSDPEIKALHYDWIRATSPWIQDFYNKWMLRGMNHQEAVSWFQQVSTNLTSVHFQSLLQKAEQELGEEDYHNLIKQLKTETILN